MYSRRVGSGIFAFTSDAIAPMLVRAMRFSAKSVIDVVTTATASLARTPLRR
jgi:hypothetical protein